MKKIISIEEKIKIYESEKLKKRKEYVLGFNFEDLSWDLKREYLIYENGNKCDKCGISEWLGFKVAIEINHINGNNKDHFKENLECLCPNCHSITSNWRGRNKTNRRFKITNGELLSVLIKNDWNFRKSLIEIGLSPKGGNYKRCHSIKREFDEIGFITKEIKVTPSFDKEEFEEIFNNFSTYYEIANFIGMSLNYTKKKSYEFGLRKEFVSKCPTKEVLLKDFYELKKFTKVSRKYGVSDNAVRKWCKNYNILETCKNIK